MGNRISDTLIRIGYDIRSQDMNHYGTIHGGRLLTLADETGFLSAHGHAGQRCLTAGVYRARFHRSAGAGEQIEIEARVALVGRTSLWVPVRMCLTDKDHTPIMDAVYVFVAVNDQGRPEPVAAITAETEEEKALQARIQAMRESFRGTRP
jgi:uncharacterized protein (TIGR00369 family)